MNKTALGLMLLLLVFVGGCTQQPQLHNFAYVTALGIDKQDGRWHAYAQVLNFSTIARTENLEVGQQANPWIGRGSGDTVTMALSDVGRSSQLQLFWGHTKMIILTEEAMKHGVNEIHKAINRYREVRYNVFLFGTKERLDRIFDTNSLLHQSPLESLLFTGMQLNSPESFILPRKVNQVIADMNEPGEYARIASVGFNSDNWSDGEKPVRLIALDGYYFFHNDKMVSWMPLRKLSGLRWGEKRLRLFPVHLNTDNESDDTVMVFKHPRLKIRPVREGGKPYFDIHVKATGYVLELGNDATVARLRQDVEQLVRQDIRSTYVQGLKLQSDPFNLGQRLYRSDPAFFRALTEAEPFFLTKESLRNIHVNVHLSGMGKYKGWK